jgi:release factor glutamine methyltransferase
MFEEFLQSYETFEQHEVDDPLLETLRLFDLLLGGALGDIEMACLEEDSIDLSHVAQKRKQGIPLEYVVGKAAFMGRTFDCSPDTLIPVEDTELLVEVASTLIIERQASANHLTIIEMGTGCGNVAVSLAIDLPDVRIMASDISPAAVEVARRNARRFNVDDRVVLLCGDLFAPFEVRGYEDEVDLIVCNPPYIPSGSLSKLPKEVIHEPKIALDGGPYGIDFYSRLAAGALPLLKPGGILVFEIGERQESLATRVLQRNGGYTDIQYYRDAADTVRVIGAVRKGNLAPEEDS